MLDADLRNQLKAYLEKVTQPIELVASLDDSDASRELDALLGEIAALSDRLELRVHDVTTDPAPAAAAGVDANHLPALLLSGAAKGHVRFLGMPTGLELGTLLSALLDVASGESGLSPATKEALQDLRDDVFIRVFVTPTCPFCPRAARTAVQMAIESPHVTADVIEANEFPELADRYEVRGVPKVVVNDTVSFVGAQPEMHFLESVRRAVGPPDEDAPLRAAR
jgi:glutaredoxin-like protein